MAYRNRGRGDGFGSRGYDYQDDYNNEEYGYGGGNQWEHGMQTNRKRRNNFDQLQQFEQRNDRWGGQTDSFRGGDDSYDQFEEEWRGGNGDRRRNPDPPKSQWSRQDNYTFDDYNDGGFSNSRKRSRDDYGSGGYSGYPKRGRDEFHDGGFSSSQKRGRFRDERPPPPPRRRDPHSLNFYDDYEEPYGRQDRSRKPLRRPDDYRSPRDRGSRSIDDRHSYDRRRTDRRDDRDRDRSYGSRSSGSSYRRPSTDSYPRRSHASHSDGSQRKKSAIEEAIYDKHRQVTVEKERRNRIGDTMQNILLAFRGIAQTLASENDEANKKATNNGKIESEDASAKSEEHEAKPQDDATKPEDAAEKPEDATTKTDDDVNLEEGEKKTDELETKTEDTQKTTNEVEAKMQEDEANKDVLQKTEEQSSDKVVESSENKAEDENNPQDDNEKDMEDVSEDFQVIDEVADTDQLEETNGAPSTTEKKKSSNIINLKAASSRRKTSELVFETKPKKKFEPVLLGAIKCGQAAMRMLVGDQVEGLVVVLSKKKPTRSLVERIKELLIDTFLKDKYMKDENITLEIDNENEYIVMRQQSISGFQVLIRFTSPQCSPHYDAKEEGEDPADVLSPESCRVALTMLRRMRFVVKQLDPSAAALTVVRVLLYFRSIEEWSKLPVWLVLVLVHVAIETAKKVHDSSEKIHHFLRVDKVFIRCIEILSSGVLLPTGEGLRDPCEVDVDVGACLAPQDAEDITLAAQTALRLIEYGKMRDVLGLPKSEKEKESEKKEEKESEKKEEKEKESEKEKE